MKVFLDANILFSAANPQWLTGRLLELLVGHAQLVTTAYALEEATRNLNAYDPELLSPLEAWRGRLRIISESAALPPRIDLPAKDRPILAAAIAAKCTHLLTGDYKHFGTLMGKTTEGVHVVSQRLMAEHLQEKGKL